MKIAVSLLLCVAVILCAVPLSCNCESAVAAVLINGDTAEVLYKKNSDTKLPMASTTKIMTALILCENIKDLNSQTTVTKDAITEGTSMGLKPGDKVSFKALLYGMLLSSGNDAANVTALAISGGFTEFASLMNKRAREIGLLNTNFVTPSGLDAENHYTTAYDLALLSREALKNKRFSKVAKTKSITLSYGAPKTSHTLKNHNRLLNYDDVIGVKTGYTSAAGRCLVSAAKKKGKYLICVTLNDKNDWEDHRKILDLGYSLLVEKQNDVNLQKKSIYLSSGGSFEIEVPKLKYYSAGGKITVKTALPYMIYTPVKKGEELGTAYYYFENKKLKQIKITAIKDIKDKKQDHKKTVFAVFTALVCSI